MRWRKRTCTVRRAGIQAVAQLVGRRSSSRRSSPDCCLSGSDAADPFVPYLPEQHYLFESGGYLTEASAGEPLDIAMGYLTSHAAQLGLASEDFAQSTVTNLYTSADTGITHIYLRQMVNGLEIDNANISVNVTADGRILNIGGGFVSLQGLAAQADAAAVAAPDALVQAGLTVGLTSDVESQVTEASDGTDQAMVMVNADYSLDPIPARLHYVADGRRRRDWHGKWSCGRPTSSTGTRSAWTRSPASASKSATGRTRPRTTSTPPPRRTPTTATGRS